nr:receptor-like protein kinase HSL1 [Setaria viridis]
MAAIRLLLAFLLLLLQAIAAASSDAEHLLAARSALRDPTGALASWGAGSGRGLPCRWARVTCANNSTTAVAGLDLSQLSLGDVFPAALCSLRSLEHLDLSVNEFMGPLPACLAALPALVHLNLAGNNFSGEIPRSIGNLSSLEQIELYANKLSGSIPVGFGGLKRLRSLDFSMNQLTGEIPEDMFMAPNLASVHMYQNNLSGRLPATLGTAQSLYDLRIFGNQFSGSLPPEFGKNCPLVFLDTSDNRLSGPIPATLCASRKLKQLMLLNNEFEGTIPVELAQCWTLVRVRLSSNRLFGTVPPQFWALPGVYLLELRGNALSGTVDPAIAGAKNLIKLLLQDNRFTGALPAKLGTLANLQEFKASNNSFSGPLPPSLANLSLLGNLDLSHNSFSGEIPRDFGKLKQLSQLSLSDNHLSGNVPSELGDIIEINTLDLSNNELSGQLPAQLQNLKLTHFNISYNKLSGTIPVLFNGLEYQESFLGNPGLCHGFCQSNGDPDAKRHNTIKLIVYIFIAAAIILFIGLAWFSYKCTLHKIGAAELDDGKSSWMLTSYHRVDFSERDIVNSLDESNVIGQGGAGKVYKAVVRPQGETMAVKKLWPLGVASKRIDSFEAEVATLSKVRHRNIVKLACSITNTVCRLLVYEYMPSGSLGDMLHSAKRSILDWPMRYKIAVNAAEGLSYLHHDCNPPIVHRDVKSNNILLDAEYGAKVADFGVAKTIGDGPATMSVIAGSCGYIAPEYAYSLRVNEKSDIYSFGVVILELVTGMKPMAPEIGEMDLVTWVSANIAQNGLESVLDQTLSVAEQFKDEMCKVLKVALLCVSNSPKSRPPMRVVVKMLLEVKEENKPMLKLTPPNI